MIDESAAVENKVFICPFCDGGVVVVSAATT